jgi:sigma-B regulation protein RsbU (phosphoserine phosphatase)
MKRHKILIVDDTPQNIHVLMEILKDHYTIVAATSGVKALDIASREPRPDLVLLDVMMPELDGYEVCRRLKIDHNTAHIPVIFVTALSEMDSEEQGLQLGAVDFITKPFQPTLVQMRIRNQLELKRHRDQLEAQVKDRTERLVEVSAVKEKLEHELDIARRLQMSMLACDRFVLPGKSSGGLAAVLRPARAVGGDLYDYTMLDSNRLLIVLGDVSDKGVAAALFMVRALTLIRSLALTTKSPGELLTRVNLALCKDNDEMMFVTVVCCIIEMDSMRWSYASGGHEPPLLLQKGEPTFLDLESGPALGLFTDCTYPEQYGVLPPDSTLLLYTDGVTEAECANRTQFGTERLIQAGRLLVNLDPTEMLEGISKSVNEFVGSAEQSDDLTMLAIRAPRAEIERTQTLPAVA